MTGVQTCALPIFTNAAQAYMEWMPIRRGPGVMGVVTTTSITQVIEWGKLATIAAFDTRISYRSKTPTIADCKYLWFICLIWQASEISSRIANYLLVCFCALRTQFSPFLTGHLQLETSSDTVDLL